MLKFIHAADFHLDSAFAALPPDRAAERRKALRALPERLAQAARNWGADLLLLSGDLFDGPQPYPETVEALRAALAGIHAPVFLAPGNHDPFTEDSPYAREPWPENVHIFRSGGMESVPLPELGVVVHGAAFTAPTREESLLRGFTAPRDGLAHLGVLHGELAQDSLYDPLSREDIAASGLAYLALGHVHKRTEPLCFGTTTVAWPGCPEGRGFDELGDKGFLAGEVSPGEAALQFIPFARRRYRIMEVDVTEGDPAETALAAIPQGWSEDVCRIVLTGSPAAPVRPERIETALAGRFYTLQVRDKTTARQELWERCGEDTLRGLFLQNLRDRCGDDPQSRRLMEQAAAFGLAAIDDREV